jgi:hypothetical protein
MPQTSRPLWSENIERTEYILNKLYIQNTRYKVLTEVIRSYRIYEEEAEAWEKRTAYEMAVLLWETTRRHI